MRVCLFVDTIVTIVYRVASSSTKSTTLTFTDIGSQKIFQNGTERRKARQIFSNVRVYLFVDMLVTIMYRVVSFSTESMALTSTDVGSLKKKKLSKMKPNAERLVKFWIRCDSLPFR